MDTKNEQKSYFFYELSDRDVKLAFPTHESLVDWATKENSAWSTVIASGPPPLPQNFRLSFERARNLISSVFNKAKEVTEDPGTRARFQSALDALFNEGQFPFPLTQVRNFLQHIKQNFGERTMQAALATIVAPPRGNYWPLELGDPTLREGFVLGTLFGTGVDPGKSLVNSATLKDLIAQFETALSGAGEQVRTFRKTVAGVVNDTAEIAKKEAAAQRFRFDHETAEFENESRNILKEITDTAAAYREHMQLRAPVDYWSKKATEHRVNSSSLGKVLVCYAIVATAGLLFFLWELTRITLPTGGADGSQYFRTASIGLIASTIVVWIGRVILRLFLSERHLATDAEERVTLVMTYLALTQEGKLEVVDRPIVLAPLFRAASDGIVKDDGAPDTSLTSILTRNLSGQR